MIITIISVILVLGGLIFFHELGHFTVARSFKMGVSTFSLGFGPKLLKYKMGKTEYALSLIPLGGYVELVGETDENDIPEGFSKEECFSTRPAWQRLLVVLAGPVANIILAWILCWGLSFYYGTPILLAEIGNVAENTPAAKANIKANDKILSINGKVIETWEEMSDIINNSQGNPMNFEIMRPNSQDINENTTYTTIKTTLSAEKSTRKNIFGEEETAWLVGIRAKGTILTKPAPFLQSAKLGAIQTWKLVELTWQGFVKLAQRVIPLDQVGGPIMIAQMVGEQAQHGLSSILALTALISINLGILNLLPIPVLDGGTIIFCCVEMLFKKPINKKFQDYAMRFGLCLLIALMVLATFNDVLRIVKSV